MCMTTTSNTLYACIIFSKSKGCVNIRELSIPQRLRGAMDPGCDSFLGVKLPVTLVSVCLLSKGPCSWLQGHLLPTSSWDWLNCCSSCVWASITLSSSSDFCFISFFRSSETASSQLASRFKRCSNSATRRFRSSISFLFDSDSSVYRVWDSWSFSWREATSSLRSLVAPAIKSAICKINRMLVYRPLFPGNGRALALVAKFLLINQGAFRPNESKSYNTGAFRYF